MFELKAPANAASAAFAATTDNWQEVCQMYAEAWLRWVTVEIGLGFHPDNTADVYSPPLPEPLRSELDPMLKFVFRYVDDPYAIGLDAFERAGLTQAPARH